MCSNIINVDLNFVHAKLKLIIKLTIQYIKHKLNSKHFVFKYQKYVFRENTLLSNILIYWNLKIDCNGHVVCGFVIKIHSSMFYKRYCIENSLEKELKRKINQEFIILV